LPDGEGAILIASNFGRPGNPSWAQFSSLERNGLLAV
jgi:hypothetical protein